MDAQFRASPRDPCILYAVSGAAWPVLLTRSLGLDLRGYDWLLLALLVLVVCLFCARFSSARRYEKKLTENRKLP